MKNLIAIEWMKLRRLTTMKVILIIYAFAVPFLYYLLSYLKLGPFSTPDWVYDFPDCYTYVAYISAWFNLLIGVIIMVFTSNEIKYKTQRQNVIDGLSKRDVILSKFAVVFLFALAITLYVAIVGMIFGVIMGDASNLFNGIEQVGVYFVSTLGYFTFAFFFANIVRIQALAIILYLFSTIIESLVGWAVAQNYYQFFPLKSFSNLVPDPKPKLFAPLMTAQESQQIPDQFILGQGWSVVVAVAYIVIFVLITYWVIKRRDI